MRISPAIILLTCLGFPTGAGAQAVPRYSVEKLADGVHAVIYNSDIDVEGNTLIVINDEDVFVVDSNAGITTARATIAEVRKLTPKPVRYVVNTHWHDDHVFGNQAYADAYPGVEFIAHPLTRQDIVNHAFASNTFVLDLIEADIHRLEGYLKTGVYRDGKPVAGELEARIRNYLANRREAFADRRAFRPVVPTVDVADALTMKRGTREIQIRFLGRGNTRGDLVVYLPAERIVATGDLVVYPVPYATNVYATDWVKTLDALMALPAATVLPGHGPVMRDWTYVRRVKDTLESHLSAVRDAKKQSLSLTRTQEVVQLPEIRDSFVAGNEPRRAGYEAFFRPTLVRNAWEELDPAIMHAYETATTQPFADGVYTIDRRDGDGGITALLNPKDTVLVTSLAAAAPAWAAVRSLRELTDKPVKHIIVLGDVAAQKGALDVLKETYPKAEVLTGAGVISPDGRKIRIFSENESLAVEIPSERIRIERGGKAAKTR
jgi:glyoxylase-like metal-dependent hydrolase (beta-lactamase superfamily II)